jgi:hypothetical protein
MRDWLVVGAICVAIVALVVLCAKWDADSCHERGGHIVPVYKGTLCVSADGRVLE